MYRSELEHQETSVSYSSQNRRDRHDENVEWEDEKIALDIWKRVCDQYMFYNSHLYDFSFKKKNLHKHCTK